MRTFLAIIGALALVGVALIVISFFYALQRTEPLLAEARAYADESIVAIATDWNGDALKERAAPELAALLEDGVAEQIMESGASLLGSMTSHDGARCELTQFEISTDAGQTAVAKCSAEGVFEKGAATFDVSVVYRGETWELLVFFVTPETTEPGPVQVAFEEAPAGKWRRIEISLTQPSIGLSAVEADAPGAGLRASDKIDNINQ